MIRDRGEHFHAAFLPAFPFSPYWLIISPRGRLHQASINSPPQPLGSRAYPFPLLYLTCSSGSQQTVKGQKAEAWEHRKYSNHCLSEGFRLCSQPGTEQGSSSGAGYGSFFCSSITAHIFTKTQPAFCFNVIKPHEWENQWSMSYVSISFTNHITHCRLWLFLLSPL